MLSLPERLLLVIDDSPTKRYGPKVEARMFITIRRPVRPISRFSMGTCGSTISLALRAFARWVCWRCRCGHCCTSASRRSPRFPSAVVGRDSPPSLIGGPLGRVGRSALKQAGKNVVARRRRRLYQCPFLRRALKTGVTIVGRLRKDAAPRDVPPKLKPAARRGRGRPRKYGPNKLSLAHRAGQKRGWQTSDCTVYGQPCVKHYKTFLATYPPVGGVIRVVLVREEHGWYAFFSTDPKASVQEILEAFADRATIEQDFHDVKEVWGSGQQQVRNIWTNLAAYNLNLWMHTLVELWTWNRPAETLVDRRDSPWDDPDRRPSHANRRKALRQHILGNELSNITTVWSLPQKIIQLAESLMAFGRLTTPASPKVQLVTKTWPNRTKQFVEARIWAASRVDTAVFLLRYAPGA